MRLTEAIAALFTSRDEREDVDERIGAKEEQIERLKARTRRLDSRDFDDAFGWDKNGR